MSAHQWIFAGLGLLMALAGLMWVLGPLRSSRQWAAGTMAAAVPLLATAMYMALGTPKALEVSAQALPHRQGAEDLQSMVQRLQQRLDKEPGDVEGWFMLARSHQVLDQWAPAAAAYRPPLALARDDPDLLADLADVLAAVAQGELEGEPRGLLDRALAADPAHPKTLLLLAAADFRQGQFAQAKARWERLLQAVPPDSQAAAIATESLTRVRQLKEHASEETQSTPPASDGTAR